MSFHFLFASEGGVRVANGVEEPELDPQLPSFLPGVNWNIALHTLPLLEIPHFLFLLSQFNSYFSLFFPSPLHTYRYASTTVHPIFHCNSMNLVI